MLRSSLALLLCGPLLSAAPTDVTGQRETSRHPASPEQVYLIIRSDDAGMSHSVNMALGRTAVPSLVVTQTDIFPPPPKVDMNTSGPLPDMSKNRQGELDALMSPRFRDALKTRNIQLLTYRQLIAMQGLNSMRRPEG